MLSSVVGSRGLVPVLGLLIWAFFYFNGLCAYRLPRGWKRAISQLFLVLASASIFVLQVNLLESLAPEDAYGNYFIGLVLIESAGALVVLFCTLIRERAKSVRKASGATSSTDQER